MTKYIGDVFAQEVCRALGIDPVTTHRIVIDIQGGKPVVVHVELYGDDKLLSVVRTLDGVEIERK